MKTKHIKKRPRRHNPWTKPTLDSNTSDSDLQIVFLSTQSQESEPLNSVPKTPYSFTLADGDGSPIDSRWIESYLDTIPPDQIDSTYGHYLDETIETAMSAAFESLKQQRLGTGGHHSMIGQAEKREVDLANAYCHSIDDKLNRLSNVNVEKKHVQALMTSKRVER